MTQKEIKSLLDFLEAGDCNIWEIETLLDNQADQKTLLAIFSKEQLSILKAIVKHSILAFDEYHNKSEDCHENIRSQIETLKAKFEVHRHETTKKYSGTPE